MENKFDAIIVDGNNLFTKYYEGYRNKYVCSGAYGMMSFLKKREKDFLKYNGEIYILFDNCNSIERKRKVIDPEYKLNRKKREDKYYIELEYIQLLLLSYKDNYWISYKHNFEADDIVYWILKYKLSDKRVLLISDDADWERLITDKFIVYKNRKLFTKNFYFGEYGFYPSMRTILRKKIIRGDKSDNIPPGLPYLPDNLLLKFMNDKRPFNEILENPFLLDYFGDDWINKFIKYKARIKLNYCLTNYILIDEKTLTNCLFKCIFKEKSLKIYYELLGFPEQFDLRLNNREINLF